VNSASIRLRSTGQVRVLGFKKGDVVGAKGEVAAAASKLASKAVAKNTKSVVSAPLPKVSSASFMLLYTAGNSRSWFLKSNRLTSRLSLEAASKQALALLSVAMPVGTIRPAYPPRPISFKNCSAKS